MGSTRLAAQAVGFDNAPIFPREAFQREGAHITSIKTHKTEPL